MHTIKIKKVSVILFFIFIHTTFIPLGNRVSSFLASFTCLAEEPGIPNIEFTTNNSELTVTADNKAKQRPILFQGKVISDNINIRSDSTTSSDVIWKMNKNEYVEVLSESYDWYKIKLPKTAPAFVKKDFITLIDDKTGKMLKDNVNIRLRPDTSSPILGKLNQDEEIKIIEDSGDWYKIEPIDNTFGWIHKSFVNKVEEKELQLYKKEKAESEVIIYKDITVEGIIKPKIIKSIATHKLISEDNRLYLLKGNKEELSSFNNRRVKIVGKVPDPAKQENPIIKVEKVEALD